MKFSFHVAVTLSSLLASALPALASTATYPGAMCQPSAGGIGYALTGAVMNNSTSTVATAVCPIVRHVNGSNGWNSLNVTVLNLHPSKPFCCTVQSFNTNDYGYGTPVQRCVGYGDWLPIHFPAKAAPTPGYLLLSCDIPERVGPYPSGVASYEVVEP